MLYSILFCRCGPLLSPFFCIEVWNVFQYFNECICMSATVLRIIYLYICILYTVYCIVYQASECCCMMYGVYVCKWETLWMDEWMNEWLCVCVCRRQCMCAHSIHSKEIKNSFLEMLSPIFHIFLLIFPKIYPFLDSISPMAPAQPSVVMVPDFIFI